MRYGVCLGIENPDFIIKAGEFGFDYTECRFAPFSRADDDEFSAFADAVEKSGIKCEAVNCFMPDDLPVTGNNVDYKAIKEYIEKGMKRGVTVGLKTIVFGSSGARNIPEGFSYGEGFRQMVYFLKEIVAPLAEKYDITVVTEPLRKAECNMINTVKEGVILAAMCNNSHISGLADIYHMREEGDTSADVRACKGLLHHAHISYPHAKDGKKRIYPSNEREYDYKSFIDAVEFAGCTRCSIEADYFDFIAEAPIALELLKKL